MYYHVCGSFHSYGKLSLLLHQTHDLQIQMYRGCPVDSWFILGRSYLSQNPVAEHIPNQIVRWILSRIRAVQVQKHGLC